MTNGAPRERTPRPSWRERKAAAAAAPEEELPPKLGHSLKELISTAGGLIHTRIALAGVELEEEIQRLIGAAVLVLVTMVAAFLALVVATFTIVLAVPPEYRVGTMIGITLVYVVIAVTTALRLKGVFDARPPIFGATLAELEKDKETLVRLSRARHVAEAEREQARAGEEDAFAQVVPAARPASAGGV